MNRKFKKSATAGNTKRKEICKTISLTEPDQSLSVREIMTRFANGTINDLSFDYDYSEDAEDMRGYDPAEMHEMAIQSSKTIKEQEDRQSKKKARDDRKKLEDEIRLQLEKPKDDVGQ